MSFVMREKIRSLLVVKKREDVSYRLGRSRAALVKLITVCAGSTERNIRALMAFESSTSSDAHGLRGTFDRVSSNPTNQKLQPPPRRCMGSKACRKR